MRENSWKLSISASWMKELWKYSVFWRLLMKSSVFDYELRSWLILMGFCFEIDANLPNASIMRQLRVGVLPAGCRKGNCTCGKRVVTISPYLWEGMHHIVSKWPLCTYAKMWWMSRMMTFCDCAQNHRARTADGKCKAEDARTTNFNAYASVHGNYAQHFRRNTTLRYPLVNKSISIVSSTLS